MTTRTVLVIEDNPITRATVRRTLSAQGFVVVDARDGREAIDLASRAAPDLILQDLLLPDIDGYELVARLRELPDLEGVPIVVFSGFLSQDEYRRATSLGFTDFLPKPVEPAFLLHVVQSLVPTNRSYPIQGGGQRRLLVVDHNLVQLRHARICLTELGFAVTTATTSRAALAILGQGGFDAVISDVLLPQCDGFRLCAEIRRDPAYAAVAVILMTSTYVRPADREVARSIGANALVVRTAELAEVIAALDVPVAAVPPSPVDLELDAHHERVLRQLAHEASMNAALAHRSAMHASMLSVIAGISQLMTRRRPLDEVLPDVLASLLEASGVARGALYLLGVTPDAGALALATTQGFSEAHVAELRTLCGQRPLFEGVVTRKSALVVGLADGDAVAGRELLRRLEGGSALLVPFVVDDACLGMLVLVSSSHVLTELDWVPFARSISIHVGQALALSRTVSELAASEARYRRIIETTNEGVWLIDRNLETTFLNARMAEMLGREATDVIGRSPAEFLDDDGRAGFTRDAAGLHSGHVTQVEARLVRRDGTALWALLGVSPTIGTDGQPDGALAMVMDVTERKHAELARRVSENRFRGLWDSDMILVAIADAEGQVRDLNDAGARMLGYSREEVRAGAVTWPAITPPRWHAADRAALAQLASGGVAGPWEKELVCKDGRHMPILTSVAAVDDSEGIVIALDLTLTKRTEAELRLVESLALTASEAPDLATAFESVLRTICETTGWTFGAAWLPHRGTQTLTCSRYWTRDPADRPRFVALIERRVEGTLARVLGSGALEWVRDLAADPDFARTASAAALGIRAGLAVPVINSEGEVIAIIEFFMTEPHDDDERMIKFVSTAAVQLASVIARKSAQHTNTELQGQLLQAQKMEAVGRLAGGIAHDFNNVLSVILSYGNMIAEALAPGDPMREDVEEICKAGQRAAGLTRQLLTFSRQQVIEAQVLDLNDVVAGLGRMLPRLLGADIDLVILPAEHLGRIHMDPGSIQQVIMNLVVNARDAMPTGGKLAIETANVILDDDYARAHVGVKPGRHVMLAITDTGCGMTAETRRRIFDPFFTTKPVGKGTGLGLSTAFGIVHQVGGSIWVYSELGLGTTFKIYLPQSDAPLGVTPLADEPPTSLRGTETILLVEDDEQVRVVARGILRKHGYVVLEASNAGEALLLSESSGAIELLLSDVVMPQMSGPQLAKRLARGRPEMRLLCMSGYTDDSVVRHGVLEGEVAYLQKPFTPDALTRKVREVLDAP